MLHVLWWTEISFSWKEYGLRNIHGISHTASPVSYATCVPIHSWQLAEILLPWESGWCSVFSMMTRCWEIGVEEDTSYCSSEVSAVEDGRPSYRINSVFRDGKLWEPLMLWPLSEAAEVFYVKLTCECLEWHSFNVLSKRGREIMEWMINRHLNIVRKHWSDQTVSHL